jgi:hypothetical protein
MPVPDAGGGGGPGCVEEPGVDHGADGAGGATGPEYGGAPVGSAGGTETGSEVAIETPQDGQKRSWPARPVPQCMQ